MSERPTSQPALALGRAIADARTSAGLTAEAVAASARIEPAAYESIESGAQEPSLEAIVGVASALGVSAAELFGRAGL